MTEPRPAADGLGPEMLEVCREARRPLILCHHNPDGDALGSAVALSLVFSQQGRKPEVHLVGCWSEHLAFMLEGVDQVPAVADFSVYDLVVLLDCHSFDRLGPEGAGLKEALAKAEPRPPLVVIDHHLLGAGEEIGPLGLHDAAASSTGELVWRLIRALGWAAPQKALQAVLMAMAADTGFFSQSNTTAGAFRAAAELIEAGGDIEDIKRRLRMEQPLRRLKLMGLALSTLETHLDGRLGVMTVDPAMLTAAGAKMSDTEEFVEIVRSLSGVGLAVLIKDDGRGPGTIRVSLRSRPEIDARALAAHFGGGGHRQASAYNDARAVDAKEALANLLAEAGRYL